MKLTTRAAVPLLLAAILLAALPAQAQRRNCPRIPSVTSDPLHRSYRAGDAVPAELLDPPFAWTQCDPPNLPAGAARRSQPRMVFLSVMVDETGAVVDARPRGAIDPEGYYDSAVAAIRNWRTTQPKWRGLPVKASIAVDVGFARAAAPEPPAAESQPPMEVAVPEPVAPDPAAAIISETAAPPASQPPAIPSRSAQAQIQAQPPGEPFAVEYYYKVKWGYADEFWRLFNRNHWPLLRRQIEMGRILGVHAERPRYHATEDGRWDFRVTIVFRSAAEANAPFDAAALERQLFSDLDAYRREEQRRFELLLAHWDVPVLRAALEP